METLKIFASVLILTLLAVCAQAAQPDLPTTVYGTVLNPDGSKAEGAAVRAQFTDSDGFVQEIGTSTITSAEAAASNMSGVIGQYFFNQGYLKAKAGTEITITVSGVSEKVLASPGGAPVKVKTLQIGSQITPQEEAQADGTFVPTDGSGYDGEGTPNEGTGMPGREGVTPSELGDGDPSDFEGTDATPNFPVLPTSIYGKLTDQEGNPLPGETVTAEFIDESGETHSATATTLTREQAESLGDADLEGYYSFNQGQLKAKPGSAISLRSSARQLPPVQSKPGETVQNHAQLAGEQAAVETEPEATTSPEKASILNRTGQFLGSVGENLSGNPGFWLEILIVAAALLIVVKGKTIWQGTKGMLERTIIRSMSRNVQTLGGTGVKSVMTKDVFTVEKDETLQTLVHKIISENIGCVVVVEGKRPIGLMTEIDILRTVSTYVTEDFGKITAGDVMTSDIKTIAPKIPLFESAAFSLKHKVRKLPIVENRELRGIITQTDILETLDRFFSKNKFEGEAIPTVGTAMSESILFADEDEMLEDILKDIVKYKVDSVIVTKSDNDDLSKGVLKGIVTERDFINLIYNSPDMLPTLKISNIMTSRVFTVTQGMDVIRANKILIGKGVRRAPVVEDGKVVGIITQMGILKALHGFLSELISKKGKAVLEVITLAKK